jgi:uncharacterized damage-inducible protein DinB
MALNASLLEQAVADLSDDQLWATPGKDSNPLIWIVGHAAASRDSLLNGLTGGRLGLPWFPAFARGAKPIDRAQCPPLAEIQRGMKDVSERLTETLAAQNAETLERPSPLQLPASDGTLRGFIAFLSFHETYHVGQAAYVRKWLGFPGMVG